MRVLQVWSDYNSWREGASSRIRSYGLLFQTLMIQDKRCVSLHSGQMAPMPLSSHSCMTDFCIPVYSHRTAIPHTRAYKTRVLSEGVLQARVYGIAAFVVCFPDGFCNVHQWQNDAPGETLWARRAENHHTSNTGQRRKSGPVSKAFIRFGCKLRI